MILTLLLALVPVAASAAQMEPGALSDWTACQAAIDAAERSRALPPRMLSAIGLAESGRALPGGGGIVPWPWSVNIEGQDELFETKAEAIAAVQAAQQHGARSIDVGCLQINLYYHPQAFANLEEAFAPATNAAYAGTFLRSLFARTGSWAAAVASYHSSTPDLGLAYAARVAVFWPGQGLTELLRGRVSLGESLTPRMPAWRAVDPAGVLTPGFRSQLMHEAAFREQRNAAMGVAHPDTVAHGRLSTRYVLAGSRASGRDE